MHNKSGLIHKSKTIFNIYSKPTYPFFAIAIIFLLSSSLLCVCIQKDNVEIISSQAQAKTSSNSLTDSNNAYIKTAAVLTTISSDSNNSYVPFTSIFALPPKIVMVYSGTQHPGVLISYKYRHGYTFGQLDIPAKNVTALLPANVVTIKKGSSIQFFAKRNPAILPPSSLSIDAYTSQGKAVGVLNITKGTSSNVALNLAQGKYILLATATWIPRSEDVTGYAIFSYMINIVS